MISKHAIIDPQAKIAENVEIGPWTIIGPDVEIGENTWIGPHVVIQGPTKIGKNNKIFQFSSIGEAPQDKKFNGETTYLEIGDFNIIREFCTFNRGTEQGGSYTRVGNHNLFMAYVHIAHDCVVHDHTIFANNASLAGHAIVQDHVTLGGFSGVNQFCTVGAHSFITKGTLVAKDIPPYFIIKGGIEAYPAAVNVIGMQRKGISENSIALIKKAFKIIYKRGFTVNDAIEQLKQIQEVPELANLIQFLQVSQMGIIH